MRKTLTTITLALAVTLTGLSFAGNANANCSHAGQDHSCGGDFSSSPNAASKGSGEGSSGHSVGEDAAAE